MKSSNTISEEILNAMTSLLRDKLTEGEDFKFVFSAKIRFTDVILILTNIQAFKIDAKKLTNAESLFLMSNVRIAKKSLGAGIIELNNSKNPFAFSANKSDLEESIKTINSLRSEANSSPKIKNYPGNTQPTENKANKPSKENLRSFLNGDFPSVEPEKLFNAALAAGASLKYSILAIDRASLSVSFQSYASEKYWDGKVSCVILKQQSGSKLLVSGRAEQGATKSGWVSLNPLTGLTQLASEGSASTAIARLKMEIVKQIPNMVDTKNPELAESKSDLPHQLMQLKSMHDAGALSDEEFEKAKSKLLS